MTPHIFYLSLLLLNYCIVIRKKQNFKSLRILEMENFIRFLFLNLISFIFSYILHSSNEYHLISNKSDLYEVAIIYFGMQLFVCLIARRKGEPFFNPFIANSKWNVIGILGILQYSIVGSLIEKVVIK